MKIRNKKRFSIVIAAFILLPAGVILGLNGFFGGGAEIPSDTMTRGLVGYWSFDEGSGATSTDISGNGNDGTLTNSPKWTTGKVSSALQFDGINDYVNMEDNTTASPLSFTSQAFSIEAWIKLDAIGGNHSIFSRRVLFLLLVCTPPPCPSPM